MLEIPPNSRKTPNTLLSCFLTRGLCDLMFDDLQLNNLACNRHEEDRRGQVDHNIGRVRASLDQAMSGRTRSSRSQLGKTRSSRSRLTKFWSGKTRHAKPGRVRMKTRQINRMMPIIIRHLPKRKHLRVTRHRNRVVRTPEPLVLARGG
ncbi:hypothetical protein Fot_11314 [Forsythia ovata]|uniref:Uncharacterized protein n=1 Tax=Forsythia ovata TaxID=205694 RepID=A0ABD1WJD3_9LAMI